MHALTMLVLFSPSPIEELVERMEGEKLAASAKLYWTALGVMEESEWYFNGAYGLEKDTETMYWRLENTPLDAPPAIAYKHLPDENTAYHHIRLNRAYERHLNERREWLIEGPETAALDLILEDTQRRYAIWSKVYDVTDRYRGRNGRRYDLHQLRLLVGEKAFYEGQFPSALPEAAYRESWSDPLKDELFP